MGVGVLLVGVLLVGVLEHRRVALKHRAMELRVLLVAIDKDTADRIAP